MWYTIPKTKEERQQVIEAFLNNYAGFDGSPDANEVRSSLEYLAEAYFDPQKFNEHCKEMLYDILNDSMYEANNEGAENFFPKDYSYEAFQKDFLKLWRTMSYNTLFLPNVYDKIHPSLYTTNLRLYGGKLRQFEESLNKSAANEAANSQEKPNVALDIKKHRYAEELKEANRLQEKINNASSALDVLIDEEQKRIDNYDKVKEKYFHSEEGDRLDAKAKETDAEYSSVLTFYKENGAAPLLNMLNAHPELDEYNPDIREMLTTGYEDSLNHVDEGFAQDQAEFKAYNESWNSFLTELSNLKATLEHKLTDCKSARGVMTKAKQDLAENQKARDAKGEKLSELTIDDIDSLIEGQKESNETAKGLLSSYGDTKRKLTGYEPPVLLLAKSGQSKELTEAKEKIQEALDIKNAPDFKDTYDFHLAVKSAYIDKKNKRIAEINQKTAELKSYFEREVVDFIHKPDREAIAEALDAASNLKEGRALLGLKKKTEPQVFTNVRNAVTAYLNNHRNVELARAAYEECRNYISTYMKPDNSGLKSGSTADNTRHQSVVRMLELMDKIPEFAAFSEKEKAPQTISEGWEQLDYNKESQAEQPVGAGWENVDANTKHVYTKLPYKQLEASLAKHAKHTKPENSKNSAKKTAFSDLEHQINKKKQAKHAK